MARRASRNPNGAGTVYREVGRAWCSEAHVDLPDGRRKRVRGRGDTPEAAIRDRILRERELIEGNPAADTITVRQLAGRWTGSAHASSWSAATRRSYMTALELHILPEIGPAVVMHVSAFDVQRVMDRVMRESKNEHVSVANRCRRVMHAMFNAAVGWGVIRSNPAASVKAVRLPSRERSWWTRGQATAFLEAAKGSPYRDLFHAAVVTGLRIGELVALQWRDVHVGHATVRRTFSQAVPGRVQEHPKSDTSRRSVPIPAELLERLEARRGQANELVFAARSGRMVNPSNVRRALRVYAVRAGVPVIRIHDLRRTYASLLAEAGYHPSVIQRLLGHSSPDLALRVYTSVREATVSGAVVTLGGTDGGNVPDPTRPEAANVAAQGGSENADEHADLRRAPVAQVDRAGDS